MPNINAGDQVDELVPDPQAAKELNISLMTVWRWDRQANHFDHLVDLAVNSLRKYG